MRNQLFVPVRTVRGKDGSVSPYLLRPLRSLDEVVAQNESVQTSVAFPCSAMPIRHALAVDDDPFIAFALGEVLRLDGYRVTIAHNGVRALQVYAEDPADVVITDLDMPNMTGQELIRHLRAVRPDLPVVVITGRVPLGGLAEIQGDDPTPITLLLKPFSRDELARCMEQMLCQ